MDNFHIVFKDNAWQIKGTDKPLKFDTKKGAVAKARKIAQIEGKSIIIHTQDGNISSVVSNGKRFAKNQKIRSANVKRRLSSKSIRKSIAKAMSERKGS